MKKTTRELVIRCCSAFLICIVLAFLSSCSAQSLISSGQLSPSVNFSSSSNIVTSSPVKNHNELGKNTEEGIIEFFKSNREIFEKIAADLKNIQGRFVCYYDAGKLRVITGGKDYVYNFDFNTLSSSNEINYLFHVLMYQSIDKSDDQIIFAKHTIDYSSHDIQERGVFYTINRDARQHGDKSYLIDGVTLTGIDRQYETLYTKENGGTINGTRAKI